MSNRLLQAAREELRDLTRQAREIEEDRARVERAIKVLEGNANAGPRPGRSLGGKGNRLDWPDVERLAKEFVRVLRDRELTEFTATDIRDVLGLSSTSQVEQVRSYLTRGSVDREILAERVDGRVKRGGGKGRYRLVPETPARVAVVRPGEGLSEGRLRDG